ncbi:MAG: prenyltransferase [Magnetococcales bacterium]|nr:prenyltransferase [Magnetococcales bacterium]
MTSPPEPHPDHFPTSFSRYFAAMRPPFLSASLVPGFIGMASAWHDGVLRHPLLLLPALLGPVLAGAGANVINDYYDHLNGCDAGNIERVYPFTGGSRMIQNQVLTPRETWRLGFGLLLVATAMGVALTPVLGWHLLGFVAVGFFIAWAYSAPPLKLNSRGLGEICIALAFGIFLPMGADFVQRGEVSWLPVAAGFPYAMLVTNLLYINQFPDQKADATAGKRHWVVRLGSARARWIYLALVLIGHGALLLAILLGWLPRVCLVALLTLPLGLAAAREVLRYHDQPARLSRGIQWTILTAIVQAVLMSLTLAAG